MSSAIKTPAFQAKAGNIQNEDGSSIYSGGEWSFKNASAVTGFHVTASGNVGIGTSSPITFSTYKILDIRGTSGGWLNMGTASTSSFYMYTDGTNAAINTQTAGHLAFGTSNTERMRIDGSGNVGIGTASPSARLDVTDAGGTVRIGNVSIETPSASGLTLNASNGAGSLLFRVAGSERMRISASGVLFSPPTYSNTSGGAANVGIAADGAFYRSTSALKYKEDITPISFGLDAVLSMKPVEYKSKCEADKDAEHKFIGFIADWEEANLPALVQKDGEGEVEGFSYDRLTAVLCKAIQEQQAMIEELKAKVSALESK